MRHGIERHPEDIVVRERTGADRAGYSEAVDIQDRPPIVFQDQVLGRIDCCRQEFTHPSLLFW